VLALAAPGIAGASADEREISTTDVAPALERSLERAEDLLRDQPADAAATRELSPLLRDVAIALPALHGAERRRARALLARPTDDFDQFGEEYGVEEEEPHCTPRFCVHWVASTSDAPELSDLDGDGVPDYVESVAELAEASYAVENVELAWRAPLSDGERGGDARVDVYLANVGRQGLYGYASVDPGQGAARRRHAYLVVDDDYAPSQFRGYDDPLDPLAVTLAHEYNHVLQFAYDVYQEQWLFESTAVWMEDRVFPESDDYVDVFVDEFAKRPARSLTDGGSPKAYGDAVLHHFLADRFGPAVVRDAWAASTRSSPKDYAVGAFDVVLRPLGTSFSEQFARFAPTTAEWRASDAFADGAAFPDVHRVGSLRPGGRKRSRLDHTGYALFDVRGAGGSRALRLIVEAGRGTRSAIALVGRRGDPVGGSVRSRVRYLRRGGRATVRLRRPGRFDRVTAVVVNADARVKAVKRLGRLAYARNDIPYVASLRRG
jgi:hypothetical protein